MLPSQARALRVSGVTATKAGARGSTAVLRVSPFPFALPVLALGLVASLLGVHEPFGRPRTAFAARETRRARQDQHHGADSAAVPRCPAVSDPRHQRLRASRVAAQSLGSAPRLHASSTYLTL